MMDIDFTGEQCIPGKTSQRIIDDHFARYKFALQFVQGKNVLDCACGSGFGSRMLKDGGATHVDGVDISAKLIDYAKNHFKIEGVDFFVDDLNSYYPKKKYDIVTSFETIEHIDDYKKAIRNLYELLNENGVLLISTPNRPITSPSIHSLNERPNNPYHCREFTISELRCDLTQVGFKIDNEDLYGHRQQRYIKNRYLRRLYKIIFQPDLRYSPDITRLYAHPRSFLIVVHKDKCTTS